MTGFIKSFFKKICQNSSIQKGAAWLAARYINFVFKTTRWQRQGFHNPHHYIQQHQGFITCFWHNRLLMGCFGWPSCDRDFHMLISSHKDGQLIAQTVFHHGIKTIVGSKNKGGLQAFRAMVAVLKEGHTVGITPDGPRGPCYSISEGVITLSKIAKVPILPFTYSTNFYIKLRSWDKFRLALPFGKGVLAWGDPVFFHDHQSMEQRKSILKKHMLDLSQGVDMMIKKK